MAQARHGASGRRRSRLILLGSVVISAAVVAAWFPAEALLHQRASLAGAQAQLATLHQQDAALAQEAHNLGDAGEIGRIAREEYQLVSPGQQAYEVLPPAGAASASASGGTPYAGDPGVSAPSAPSAAAELPPGTPTTSTKTTATTTTTAPSHAAHRPGLLSRMAHSLEFWR